MKKIFLFCILSIVTILSYAQTCPLAPKGYQFRVGAWGDHVSERSDVRCHYYSGDKHIQINAGVWLTKAAFANHPQWGPIGRDQYLLCSPATNVHDCPFDV